MVHPFDSQQSTNAYVLLGILISTTGSSRFLSRCLDGSRPPPSATHSPSHGHGKGMYTGDNTTWSQQQKFGKSRQYTFPDSNRNVTDDWSQDHESSAHSSSKTKSSTQWITLSETSSITSLSSSLSPTTAPKLVLDIPSHSLKMGAHLLSNSHQGTSGVSTSFHSSKVGRQASESARQTNYIYCDKSSEPLHAGPSKQATPNSSLSRFQGVWRSMTEPIAQAHPFHDELPDSRQDFPPIKQAIQSRLQTFNFVDGVVTSGTLEGLVQFLIAGFGKLRTQPMACI